MNTSAPHIPVMLPEVLEALAPRDGEVYVDGTFGAGGYTSAILAAADCRVIAIDRDAQAPARASALAEKSGGRLQFVAGTFGDVRDHLGALGIAQVDGFVLDIGVSSMQIDDAARGFSFAKDGPLDMRMDTTQGQTAADLVNELSEKELADIIFRYGEERHARRIAAAIVRARAEAPLRTTLELARIVQDVVLGSARKFAIHPATRTFQALRIAVNAELEQLEAALDASLSILREGGRLVVVSFHSLEDSIVKDFFRKQGATPSVSRHLPEVPVAGARFVQSVRKALAPSDAECAVNPRARSAKLRFGVRTAERMAA